MTVVIQMRDLKAPPINGPRKPIMGEPCNGCGMCCVSTPCPLALLIRPDLPVDLPCPLLLWVDGVARCPLLIDPETKDLARAILGPGDCDSGPDGGGIDDEVGQTARQFFARTFRLAADG